MITDKSKTNRSIEEQSLTEKLFDMQGRNIKKFISIIAEKNDISKIIDKGQEYAKTVGRKNIIKGLFANLK